MIVRPGLLRAVTNIAPEVSDDGAKATALLDQLFPDGTGFTRLDAAGLWDRSDSILTRIGELGIEPAIHALINPRLLSNVRHSFERLSRAIQVSGEVRPTFAKNALRDGNARFSFALAKYARALSVRVSDDDELSFDRFMSALAPIDAMRITPGSAADVDEDDLDDTDADPAPTPIEPEPIGPSPFVTDEE